MCGDPASHSAMNVFADSSALSQRPSMKSIQMRLPRMKRHTRGIAVSLGESLRLGVELVRAPKVARERRVDTARLLTIEPRSASRPRARSRARARCPPCRIRESRSFFVMPIVVSACASKLVEPELGRHGERLSRAGTCLLVVAIAISRIRAEKARTRAAAAETESPASSSARSRCSWTGSCSPRSQKTRERNDSASDARSVSPTASSASRAVSSASCWRVSS